MITVWFVYIAGADINRLRGPYYATIRLLVEVGADVDAQDADKRTVLNCGRGSYSYWEDEEKVTKNIHQAVKQGALVFVFLQEMLSFSFPGFVCLVYCVRTAIVVRAEKRRELLLETLLNFLYKGIAQA